MCYEIYERLRRAQALQQAVKQSENPDREASAQNAHARPAEPETPAKVDIREEEPA